MKLNTLALVQDEDIQHFALHGLLPDDHEIALNTSLGTMSCTAIIEGHPRVLVEQHFTTNEIGMLVPLLDAYPYYCAYEVLHASFNNGRITEKGVERSRERLQEALEVGEWDTEMRPVRNVLSRTRLKTRELGIEISSILETGYILMETFKRRHPTVVIERR